MVVMTQHRHYAGFVIASTTCYHGAGMAERRCAWHVPLAGATRLVLNHQFTFSSTAFVMYEESSPTPTPIPQKTMDCAGHGDVQ